MTRVGDGPRYRDPRAARTEILARLERARPPAAPAPLPFAAPPPAADPIGRLRSGVEAAGGRLEVVPHEGWPGRIDWPIDPETASHVYSAVPEVAARGIGRGATSDRALEALEICVLRADLAVVENGAAWHVPRDPRERVAALLTDHLVVVVDRTQLVPTLHEAYARIDLASAAFGWFLCGPSKTADIEQALVHGAHGPRSQSLVVLESDA
jgi:L-lactate dehydrogenase complex protein LldG